MKTKDCGKLLAMMCALLVCQAAAIVSPFNGSFELSEPNESKSSQFSFPINDPNGWQTINFVTVSSGFLPLNFPGTKTNWQINMDIGLRPFKGNNVLVLSSSDSSVGTAEARQSVTIGEGDRITGAYFFGTCDYRPWDDWGDIRLIPKTSGLPVILVAYADIDLLGENFGSFGGWQKFSHIFSAAEAGDYDLVLSVNDKDDFQLESYLIVDNITIFRNDPANPQPEDGDFNCDGTVDIADFAMLANDWQYDCAHPRMYDDRDHSTQYYDPNCNCLLGTDMNKNGIVEYNDITILSDNWLLGQKQE